MRGGINTAHLDIDALLFCRIANSAAQTAAVLTAQIGGNLIDVHGKLGLFVVGLLAFRLVWGLLGSTYARFAQFFPTPSAIKAYLRGEFDYADTLVQVPRTTEKKIAGYAAMTLVPASASVLTVEYKMNLVAPADGEKLFPMGHDHEHVPAA